MTRSTGPHALHDVVIVGGGHNALVAAAYLALAGRSVLLLERLAHVGGAAVSERPWPGVDARISRYSYLVSLLPASIVRDLGLDITLRRRRISSYTPDPSSPEHGVLIDHGDAAGTAASFARTTGDRAEAARYAAFSARVGAVARAVFPTLTQPLPDAGALRRAVGDDELWHGIVDRPLGDVVRESVRSDLTRGIVMTDGLIGTFASSDDASLRQNRCFLYHVIGGGTGDWDVPVGGMGSMTDALRAAAVRAGATIRVNAEVIAVSPDGEVTLADGERVAARLVLSGVGPAVLDRLVGSAGSDSAAASRGVEGSQVKVNMLLARLPRLRDGAVDPAAAFAGTFHVNETLTQLDSAHAEAEAGRVPSPLPAEIYCHSLTDPSILGPDLRAEGAQTLTLFGLHVPHRLVTDRNPDASRTALLAAAQTSLDSVLAEPIEDVIYRAPDGTPCVEARTTLDLQESLGMVAGDIFHGPLAWPWNDDDSDAESGATPGPAERWGVATAHPRVLLCGAGARRGGGVSGVGGQNAAMAALEILDR
ncbi:phytoene desaturase family protein [Microbacterium sp.]|jgi:phytoene dehydrogenase-like protein|uniref:phytoene desaturase family protein n=1 Tax=Microbacterium sp. TaxID=51671 RepID=UPI0037C6B43F